MIIPCFLRNLINLSDLILSPNHTPIEYRVRQKRCCRLVTRWTLVRANKFYGIDCTFSRLWGRIYTTFKLCKAIRCNEESIVCSNEYSKIFEASFNKCYYFGDPNASGFVRKTNLTNSYICYDYIVFNSGGKMKSTLYTQTMILSARYGFIVPTASMEILPLGMLVQFQS